MSNVRRFSDRSSIADEAREWLIRLDSDAPLDESEAGALREWLGRSPAHRRELKRISGFWDNANVLTELAVPLHHKAQTPSHRAVRRGYALFGRYAAGGITLGFVLAATFALMSWLLPQPESASQGLYATGVGEQRTITLPDGSSSQLNTDSLIQVSYTDKLRKLRLLRGEAHFIVAPDPGKPFEVYAEGSMVRAVGTAFSVRLLSDDVKVTVREGEVELVTVKKPSPGSGATGDTAGGEVLGLLQHGQSAVIGASVSAVVDLDEEKLADELSWRDGFLSFSGEPLASVVTEINRYTSKTIEIADPELETVPVGGRFRIDDLDEIFEVLQTSFGIRVSRVGGQYILLRSAAGP